MRLASNVELNDGVEEEYHLPRDNTGPVQGVDPSYTAGFLGPGVQIDGCFGATVFHRDGRVGNMGARVDCARTLGWVANGRLGGRLFAITEPIRDAFRNSSTRAAEWALSAKKRIPARRKDRLNHKAKKKATPRTPTQRARPPNKADPTQD